MSGVKEEKLKCNMRGKQRKKLKKGKEEKLKNHASSDEEEGEIRISCWLVQELFTF